MGYREQHEFTAGFDDPYLDGFYDEEDEDDDEWPSCSECGDPTDDEHGNVHAACGQFNCPGDCGRVITVPMLGCARCVAWIAQEDEAERLEAGRES